MTDWSNAERQARHRAKECAWKRNYWRAKR
jgi:hypothetical protein